MPSYHKIGEAVRDVERPGEILTFVGEDSSTSSGRKFLKYSLIAVASTVLFSLVLALSGNTSSLAETSELKNAIKASSAQSSDESSLFDSLGRYVMKDFDKKKPMSNFLSGLGGIWGVPMWAFYVNRGQGMTAFGIQNKDGGIAKFNTAEKAYLQTPFTGFRTFVKGSRAGKSFEHMPFFPLSDTETSRDMIIGMNEMEIEEVAPEIGLQTNVLYFTIPNEDFPAIVRQTTFTNLDEKKPLKLEALDGLAKLIPSGLSNGAIDNMGRTMEAWMNVYNLGKDEIIQPFYHISQGTADSAQVQIIKDGHFVLAFESTIAGPELLPFVVDPSVVFNTDTTLTDPSGFFGKKMTVDEIVKQPQGTTSRTPAAFAGVSKIIPAGGSVTITSVYGHAADLDSFLNIISPKILSDGFVARKRKEAQELVDTIISKVETKTGSDIFNAYIKQSFLDNVLRGGLPITLGDPANPKIYHIFSRIHGDLERDYNFYQIDTTYFSQGPGNFRDVNQNRRLDVLHTPEVGDFNVKMFLSFVQADGYNPLTVASTVFKVPTDVLPVLVPSLNLGVADSAVLTKILSKPFRPGQLFNDLKAAGVVITGDKTHFINSIIAVSIQSAAGQYAQNGFWADHWTYTLDLVDNYLSIYPDKKVDLLFDSEPVPFFMSPAIVKSRADRYNLFQNPQSTSKDSLILRVYGAVSQWGEPTFPEARKHALEVIFSDPSYIADSAGAGGIWQRTKTGVVMAVSAISKLLILGSLKFSTLDPEGMGVEMEGGKPGWNDAMNGLPGILGSGMPETYEMLRILHFVSDTLVETQREVSIPVEFAKFLDSIGSALDVYLQGGVDDAVSSLAFWNSANDAREEYRASTVVTFDGKTVSFTSTKLIGLIAKMVAKTEAGIAKALSTNGGLSPTYFYYDCTDFKVVISKPNFLPNSTILAPGPPPGNKLGAGSFTTRLLPVFLEGPTRHLKVLPTIEAKRDVYRRTRASDLYDQALEMYMLSGSLAAMGQDVGRMKAFSPGWLENQSIWLHMSYKFYLELLRAGLYKEFFAEIATGLVPFMDNERYGRSPLEAASFIVSSAFPDAKLHGASFLARLSGSTAEMLSMWAIMMFGQNPFSVSSSGELQLAFAPVLPGSFFTNDDTVSSTFLGSIKVTYHNEKREDTWRITPQSASYRTLDNAQYSLNGAVFTGATAHLIRERKVKSINIYY